MAVPVLHLHQLNRPGQAVSVYRTFYPPAVSYPAHRHSFSEMFFIESGQATQTIGERSLPLVAGDLGMVDAACVHALQAAPRTAMVLVNLAFSAASAERLRWLVEQRPTVGGPWPWRPREALVYPLDAAGQGYVRSWIDRLDRDDSSELELAAFLCGLLLVLGGAPQRLPLRGPPWLQRAVSQLEEADILQGGVIAFTRRCGHSPSQVVRAVRTAYACTPIALISRTRMERMARLLRSSDRSIAAIADECGVPNRSHCYRLFQRFYQQTPAAYRAVYQGGLVTA